MKSAPTSLQNFLVPAPPAVPPAQMWIADLLQFTLNGGQTLYYTSHDQNIAFGGNIYLSVGPYLQKTSCKTNVGLSVDQMTLSFTAAPTHQVNSVPFIQALIAGVFDGALVTIRRMIGAFPGDTSKGTYIRFVGNVSTASDMGLSSAKVLVKPKTELLNVDMPRSLIQPGCRWSLFDAGCTLNKTSFKTSTTFSSGCTTVKLNTALSAASSIAPPAAPSTTFTTPATGVNINATTYYVKVTYVTSLGETIASDETRQAVGANQLLRVTRPSPATGATKWNVYVSTAPGNEIRQNLVALDMTTDTLWDEPSSGLASNGAVPPRIATDGYYAQGWLHCTSGANSGLDRMVLTYNGGVLTVVPALPFAPAAGDGFDIYPGCDLQQSTCKSKFNNLVNFGGFPYVPTPEVGI